MITDPWYVYHKLIVQFDKTSLRGFLGVFGAFILLVPALVPLGPGLVTVCFRLPAAVCAVVPRGSKALAILRLLSLNLARWHGFDEPMGC